MSPTANSELGVPLQYIAVISQAAAAAPTLDTPGVRFNTLGCEPVYSRNAAGVYDVIFPNPVILPSTVVFITSGIPGNSFVTGWTRLSATTVRIFTSDQTGNLVDSRLTNATLDIMVFP